MDEFLEYEFGGLDNLLPTIEHFLPLTQISNGPITYRFVNMELKK